ncbi:MAG: SIR2 family protein [Gammaproteobacteria bacterium]|nr:SIR2 family protein [Gammaproteobacteria bacterium]
MQTLRKAGEHYKHSGDDGSARRNAKAIAQVLDYRLRAAGAAYRCTIDPDNIEDLFSLIDTEEGSGKSNYNNDYIRQAIAATIDFAHRTYARDPRNVKLMSQNAPGIKEPYPGTPAEEHNNVRLLPRYDAYLAAMTGMLYEPVAGRRDTIITFNYDTLVEEALTNLRKSYSYGFEPEEYGDGAGGGFVVVDSGCPNYLTKEPPDDDVIRVLKLHGSVNWGLRRAQSSTTHGTSVDELLVCRTFNELEDKGIDRLFIEPPTWRKGYGTPGRGIATVWNTALRALRTASRITIIGYSLPLTDVHFRYLIAAGLRENISLQELLFVNPTLSESAEGYKEITSRIFQILRPELRDRGIIQFIGNELEPELIVGNGLPVSMNKECLFAKLNPNAGNRAAPLQW